MPFIACGGKGSGGEPAIDISMLGSNETIIDFLNDSRFVCTDNGYPWTQQNKFQYDGVDMWSPPAVPNGVTGSEYILNNTNETIFFRVAYKTSTEGASYDYINVIVNGVSLIGNKGGSDEGKPTTIFAVPAKASITLSYCKDGSSTGGIDSVGAILYEIGD